MKLYYSDSDNPVSERHLQFTNGSNARLRTALEAVIKKKIYHIENPAFTQDKMARTVKMKRFPRERGDWDDATYLQHVVEGLKEIVAESTTKEIGIHTISLHREDIGYKVMDAALHELRDTEVHERGVWTTLYIRGLW